MTNISVSFTKQLEGLSISHSTPFNVDANSISVEVPNLEAGFEYVFNVTARNNFGSSTVFCGPTLHVNGESAYHTNDNCNTKVSACGNFLVSLTTK